MAFLKEFYFYTVSLLRQYKNGDLKIAIKCVCKTHTFNGPRYTEVWSEKGRIPEKEYDLIEELRARKKWSERDALIEKILERWEALKKELEVARLEREKRRAAKARTKKVLAKENRIFHDGDPISIVYPSGKRVEGRLRLVNGLVIAEGVEYGTAAWVFAEEDLNSQVIDLTKVDHIRVIHSKKGRAQLQALLNEGGPGCF